jgi:hypothetical protein
MTPKEVGGLQSLAMAHGGSLTINPQTGLPEAGFLSKMLPMIAGLALNAFVPGVGLAVGNALGGIGGAAGTGLLVGGATGLATGSLKKGFMAGLGAYGGAGLGEGLAAASTVPTATATPTITNAAATQLAPTSPLISNAATNPLANIGVENFAAPTAFQTGIVPSATAATPATTFGQLGSGLKNSFSSVDGLKALSSNMSEIAPYSQAALGISALDAAQPDYKPPAVEKALIRPYDYSYNRTNVEQDPYSGSAERTYFNPTFTARKPYQAPGPEYMAVGGAVEDMSAQNSLSGNMMYPQAHLQTDIYSNPAAQRPMPNEVIGGGLDAPVNPYSGEAAYAEGGKTDGKYWSGTAYVDKTTGKGASTATPSTSVKYNYDPQTMQFSQAGTNKMSGGMAQPIMQPQAPAQPMMQPVNIPAYQTPEQQLGLGGFYDYMNQQLGQMGGYQGYAAGGGISHLGGYSDGGRLLRGPGDGVSDSIPAQIGEKQPARLADGEFVVPARIVSEIGNGSTEAGARKLYAMMDRVQKARGRTTGKNRVAVDSKAEKLLPA